MGNAISWFFSKNICGSRNWRTSLLFCSSLCKPCTNREFLPCWEARISSKNDWQTEWFLIKWVVSIGMMYRVFPKQDATAAVPRTPAKAIRTAGSNAANRTVCGGNFCCLIDWVKSSSFISWSLKTRLLSASKLVKWSIRVVKVVLLYRLCMPDMISLS